MELPDGCRFGADVQADVVPHLVMDEPAPLGTGNGPHAARVAAAGRASANG